MDIYGGKDVTNVNYGTCKYCGKLFVKVVDRQIYCDRQCRLNDSPDHKKFMAELARNHNDIVTITRLAAEEGLSYGKFVAKHRLFNAEEWKRREK